MELRPLRPAASAPSAYRSSGPLSPASLLAIQRTAGNRAACQVIKVQRAPGFAEQLADMSDMELLKAYRYDNERHILGKRTPADRKALMDEMIKRDLLDDNTELDNPLDDYRDLMPTGQNVALEVAKPTSALAATGAAAYGTKDLSTASGTVSYGAKPRELVGSHTIGGPTTTHGAVGAEVFGGLVLGDAMYGVYRGNKARKEAAARGDWAGVRLGKRKMKQQGWGVAGGATATAGGGIKLGAALGSTAAGLAAAAGGLGIVGGALTAAQGSWKIYLAGKKLNDLAGITPISAKGQKWKEYVQGREKRKAGINALKVAAGALGIAAGALLIASNPAGWAVGIAALVAGGLYAGWKVAGKIADVSNRRSAKKKAEAAGTLDPLAREQNPELAQADPGRRKEVHRLADKVAQENSENAKYAAAMIAALRKGEDRKLDIMVYFRDQLVGQGVFAQDGDFTLTRGYLKTKRKLEFSAYDLERFDAHAILQVLDVFPETALSESGQDLIQKKLSVAEAS